MLTVSWASLVGLELAYPADPATGLPSNTIRVLVTDSSGTTAWIRNAHLLRNRPFARVDVIRDRCDCNQSVNFAASRSFHGWPGRSIVKYEWDFDTWTGVSRWMPAGRWRRIRIRTSAAIPPPCE